MRSAILVGGAAIIAACGCSVGRDYQPPALLTPTTYPGASAASAASLTSWWRSFGDPRLDALVERGRQADLDLQLAFARLAESRAMAGIADAAFLPSIDASAAVTREAMSHHGLIPFFVPPATLYQAGFDADWEIDLWGAVRREREGAVAGVESAAWNVSDVANTVTAEIVRAYIDLLAARRRLAIARDAGVAANALRDLMRARLAAGLVSELAVAEAESRAARASAGIPQATNRAEQQLRRLATLVGGDPGAVDEELAAEAPWPAMPAELSVGVPADLLRRRPDLRAAERRLAAATARVGVAEADLYPRLSLSGTFGVQSTDRGQLFTKSSTFWSIGPAVRWQLLDWQRVRSAVKAADARVDQAMLSYRQALLVAEEDVANALTALAADERICAALSDAADAEARGEQAARDLRRRGVADDLAVDQATLSRLEAQDALAVAEQARLTHAVALTKALGGGWDHPLTAAVEAARR